MRARTFVAPVLLLVLAAGCEDAVPTGVETSVATTLNAMSFGAFGPAVSIEDASPGADSEFNTAFSDGCPFTSRDGKSFYEASNRPGGLGGIDIWVSTRKKTSDPWGAPVNVGAPVNSEADDFCPTLDRDGHRFFFVSRRVIEGVSCGAADIYVTRKRGNGTYDEPQNLGCEVNSEFEEASPFPLPQAGGPPVLYFSSARSGGGDVYVSESHGGVYGAPQLVPGVNGPFDDGQPNVRRDGLEIFFYSARPGTLGGRDIYSATRASTSDAWSTPVNLGPNINTAFSESRPSLSWDGTTLYFGSTQPGEGVGNDIYVSTRTGGGIACGREDLVREIFRFREINGASLAPPVAHLFIRSIKTLELRVLRHNQNAAGLASFLRDHSGVERVFYPGLEDDPGHEIAARQMYGFGGLVSFSLPGDFGAVKEFLEKLRYAHRAASLGSVGTLIGPPAVTSHVELTPEGRAELGIPETLIRCSVGIENLEDIVEDFARALG